MKPMFSAGTAWCCTVLSAFAIVILGVIGLLFKNEHETMMGSIHDPEDGKAVANTVFASVLVYVAFFVFCAGQAWLNMRQPRGVVLQ